MNSKLLQSQYIPSRLQVKYVVWCAISAKVIVILGDDLNFPTNSSHYLDMISESSVPRLYLQRIWFQQKRSFQIGWFQEKWSSSNDYTDVTLPDFFLRDYLKSRVYLDNPLRPWNLQLDEKFRKLRRRPFRTQLRISRKVQSNIRIDGLLIKKLISYKMA